MKTIHYKHNGRVVCLPKNKVFSVECSTDANKVTCGNCKRIKVWKDNSNKIVWRELPQTAIQHKTYEEACELYDIFERFGWNWRSGEPISKINMKSWIYYNSDGCLTPSPYIFYGSKNSYENYMGYKVISLEEFKKLQGIESPVEKAMNDSMVEYTCEDNTHIYDEITQDVFKDIPEDYTWFCYDEDGTCVYFHKDSKNIKYSDVCGCWTYTYHNNMSIDINTCMDFNLDTSKYRESLTEREVACNYTFELKTGDELVFKSLPVIETPMFDNWKSYESVSTDTDIVDELVNLLNIKREYIAGYVKELFEKNKITETFINNYKDNVK